MGVFTPNIGLYIPAAGETNYTDAFAAGMMNLDTHDHSGGPNKGLPISSSGLADFSVTYRKLNSNVADITTGIGTNPASNLQNQLQLLGVLRNLFTLASVNAGTGFLSINGSTINGRTFQSSSDLIWTAADGIASDPSIALDSSFYSTGTFTPTIQTSNSDIGTINYSLQSGNYQKIGKWIMIDLEVVFTVTMTPGTGNLIIQGLPVASIGTYWFAGYINSGSLTPNQQVCSYQADTSNVLIFPVGASNSQLAVPVSTPYGFNMQMTGIYQWTV